MARPRPVLTSAGITGGIQGVVLILTFLGYSDASAKLAGETQGIVAFGIAAVAIGGNLIHGLHAQKQVTPKNSPQTDDGVQLVPGGQPAASAAPQAVLSGPSLIAPVDSGVTLPALVEPLAPVV